LIINILFYIQFKQAPAFEIIKILIMQPRKKSNMLKCQKKYICKQIN